MLKLLPLISDNGEPFQSSYIRDMCQNLNQLSDLERNNFRNENAKTIATHDASQFLIVSGPGTGKSYLFLKRIDYWYKQNSSAKILVTSFVRKLVADLQSDINNDKELTDEQKKLINVSTLHKFARSIVEKNHGTKEWRFKPHFKIISQNWKSTIWEDVLSLSKSPKAYLLKKFEEQLHNDRFEESEDWIKIKNAYYKICQFYNAAGFSDLILRAKEALIENPKLCDANYSIIDEYQDFNSAEEALINQIMVHLKSLLIVGDDEQVLYETLKSSRPKLIQNLYENSDYINGMLPFCGRSSFHITKTAEHFMHTNREDTCIEKIYLPIKAEEKGIKTQLVACATPATAIDYIEKFISENQNEIVNRQTELANATQKDPFLLILTPVKEITFYGKYKQKIIEIACQYQSEKRFYSDDYYKILNYYSLSEKPNNNFYFRKVIFHEGLDKARIYSLLEEAMSLDKNLCELNHPQIQEILQKCNQIKSILGATNQLDEKITQISKLIEIVNVDTLKIELTNNPLKSNELINLEHQEEESAELEEIEIQQMGAIEVMTIVGSKGLSADHVIIIGFDDVNLKRITSNAFYVAITRARKSLHILTALQSGGASKPHQFLEQLPEEHLEFYSYKKTGQVKTLLSDKEAFNTYLLRCKKSYKRR